MVSRTKAALVAASFFIMQCAPLPALADNQMGYQLLGLDQVSALPRNGGKLGMDVGKAQQITSGGLTFELLKVNSVRGDSPAAKAGLKAGDQIIAVDGRVFPSVATFAAYAGSIVPGHQISMDYIPSGGGPEKAQRVSVTVGGQAVASPKPEPARPSGLSTGEKVAIGVGAAALFGCYKLGCFSHKAKPVPATP